MQRKSKKNRVAGLFWIFRACPGDRGGESILRASGPKIVFSSLLKHYCRVAGSGAYRVRNAGTLMWRPSAPVRRHPPVPVTKSTETVLDMTTSCSFYCDSPLALGSFAVSCAVSGRAQHHGKFYLDEPCRWRLGHGHELEPRWDPRERREYHAPDPGGGLYQHRQPRLH